MKAQKILLALQFWRGDKDQAMALARLIADLCPAPCEDADFLFVSRFDCNHDLDTVKHVARRFKVHQYVNRRRGTEWPHGCNDLWFGTMDWAFTFGEAKRIPTYKAILTFEADSCPLSPNWISELSAQWDRLRPAKVVGPLLQHPGEHINGNALFSGDKEFLHWVARKVGGCTPAGGWDYVLRHEFKKRGWADCPPMKSFWKTPTMTEPSFLDLVSQGVVFLHGVKDDSVLKHVRKRFINPS